MSGSERTSTPPEPESLDAAQAARRQRILDAAMDLLAGEGYDRIQMKDVAAEAGVALGTVYRYFASKEHLFAAAMLAWMHRLDRRLDRRAPEGDDDAERLVSLMSLVLEAFERSPRFHHVLLVLAATDDPHAARANRAFQDQAFQTFGRALRDADPEAVEDVLHVVSAVLDGVLRSWSSGSLEMADARDRMRRSIALLAPNLVPSP